MIKTAISLFSGCGGDTLGMEKAGINVVGFTEWDKTFQKTHLANFPNSRLIGNGNMLEISDEEFESFKGKIDLVFAGFPCQGFSNAGKKKKDDNRNSLFHQFVRCVDKIQPLFIMGENVAGLLTRKNEDNVPYIQLVKEAFEKIGYVISYKLYSCEKLIPQIRKRLIIFGVKKEKNIDPSTLLPDIPKSFSVKDISNIVSFYSPHGESIVFENEFDLNLLDESFLLKEETTTQTPIKIEPPHPYLLLKQKTQQTRYPDNEKGKVYEGALLSFEKRISPVHAEIINRYKPCKTIICTYENQPRLFVPQKKMCGSFSLRCLLVDELKQIQGFPKDYILLGNRKQQIHMIGNAVPPQLITFVLSHVQEKMNLV
jgi:DNA (cytosine-5)-methyltransferase 1